MLIPKEAIVTHDKSLTITNAPKRILDKMRDELTVKNPKFESAKKYGRYTRTNLHPFLYQYKNTSNGIIIPRGYTEKALSYLENYTEIDNRVIKDEIDFEFLGTLRPYQEKAVKSILPNDYALLQAGTGSGKTVISLAIIARRKQPTLILVHSKELLYQWHERIEQFLGIEAGLVGDGKYIIKPITIAIINSAKNNIEDLVRHPGQICIDESHRVASSMFTEVTIHFDCKYILGLSATPYRRDKLTKLIWFYVGPTKFKIKKSELEKQGAIVKPEFIQKNTNFDFNYKDNYGEMIKTLCNDNDRNLLIINDVLEEIRQNSGAILIVSDRVSHCEAFLRLLNDNGIDAELLVGKTKSKERTEVTKNIKSGKSSILISTVQLIGEGFDCPGLCSLFLGTPIKFKGRLDQVVGRILRPAKGKKAKVYDYKDLNSILANGAKYRLEMYG